MSNSAQNEQPDAAVAATEAQPVDETTAVAPAAEGEEKTDNMLKTTTEPDHKDFKKNRKYDATSQPVSDDPAKIRAQVSHALPRPPGKLASPPNPRLSQVEFYFSDSNLPTDKFMWESTGGEENKPMSLKTICNFKRMRQFQPYTAVVAALRESSFLEVAGEEGEEVLTRKRAYVSSTEAQKARLNASVYAKGFGDEEPSTQFDIEAFFSTYGHVKHVKLRRTTEELFKGSVFVEFETVEEAEAFANLDPKPTWKGHDLLTMTKKAYLDEKNRQIKEGLLEPNTTRRPTFFEGKERGGSRGGRGGRGRGGKDQNGKSGDWKDKRGDDQKSGGF